MPKPTVIACSTVEADDLDIYAEVSFTGGSYVLEIGETYVRMGRDHRVGYISAEFRDPGIIIDWAEDTGGILTVEAMRAAREAGCMAYFEVYGHDPDEMESYAEEKEETA